MGGGWEGDGRGIGGGREVGCLFLLLVSEISVLVFSSIGSAPMRNFMAVKICCRDCSPNGIHEGGGQTDTERHTQRRGGEMHAPSEATGQGRE